MHQTRYKSKIVMKSMWLVIAGQVIESTVLLHLDRNRVPSWEGSTLDSDRPQHSPKQQPRWHTGRQSVSKILQMISSGGRLRHALRRGAPCSPRFVLGRDESEGPSQGGSNLAATQQLRRTSRRRESKGAVAGSSEAGSEVSLRPGSRLSRTRFGRWALTGGE